jgi:hypothetical protein
MTLFDRVVEIFDLTDLGTRSGFGIAAFDQGKPAARFRKRRDHSQALDAHSRTIRPRSTPRHHIIPTCVALPVGIAFFRLRDP